MHSAITDKPMKKPTDFLSSIFTSTYGTLWISLYTIGRLVNYKRDTPAERDRILALRELLWNPEGRPLDGLVSHQFWTDEESGQVLHYLLTQPSGVPTTGERKTIIFLHGFPDTPFSYKKILQHPSLQNHTCVALSLPSYGGSTPFSPNTLYTPNTLYPLLARFMLHIKSTYPTQPLTLFGHDWGATVVLSLAHILPDTLVTRIVAANSIDPWGSSHAMSVMLSTAGRSLLCLQLPTFFRNVGVVLNQIFNKSHYIFVFRTSPTWFRLWSLGPGFVDMLSQGVAKIVCKDTTGDDKNQEELDFYRATVAGPLPQHVAKADVVQEGVKYDHRVPTDQHRRFHEMIRYYQEPLARGRFKDSVLPAELNRYVPSAEEAGKPSGADMELGRRLNNAYRVPTTFLFGDADHALDWRLATQGASHFGARVKILKGLGHWGVMGAGQEVIDEILRDE